MNKEPTDLGKERQALSSRERAFIDFLVRQAVKQCK
jgi:hypothetical protein